MSRKSNREKHFSSHLPAILWPLLTLLGCVTATTAPNTTTVDTAPIGGTTKVPKIASPSPEAPASRSEQSAVSGPELESIEIGSASPTLVRTTAPDGSWSVICQAREDTDQDGRISVEIEAHGELSGDLLQTYFVKGGGSGAPIDAFVAGDPSGRFVALIEEGRLVLRDLANGTVQDLSAHGADIRTDQSSFRPHRAGSFDRTGTRFLYLSTANDQARVVVLDLASGKELSIDPGPGLLWRADFDATGEQVIMQIVDRDTNKNQTLEWPYPEQRSSISDCGSPIPHYNVWEFPGDQPSVRVATLEGKVQDAPGFVAALGDSWLARDEDNALALERPDQAPVQWESRQCNARVLHADGTRKVAVIACLDQKGGPQLELLGDGYKNPLHLDVNHFEIDGNRPELPRLLPLYPKNNTVLLDLDTRTVVATLEKTNSVIATHGERALIRQDRTLSIWEAGALEPLPGKTDAIANLLQTESMVLVSPLVVDLGTGKLLGKIKGHALALARNGDVLMASNYPEAPVRLPRGPLHWQRPTANPPSP